METSKPLLTLKGFTACEDAQSGVDLACNIVGITSAPKLLLFSLGEGAGGQVGT